SVANAIAQAAFEAELTVKTLILPGGTQVGALENLCLQSIAGQPIESCVEEYMSCAARATGYIHTTTTNKAKARVHAWLAAQPRPDLRLGNAAALQMCGGSARRYRKTRWLEEANAQGFCSNLRISR